jgi:hypothetical protein
MVEKSPFKSVQIAQFVRHTVFSIAFSMVGRPNAVLTPLKRASKVGVLLPKSFEVQMGRANRTPIRPPSRPSHSFAFAIRLKNDLVKDVRCQTSQRWVQGRYLQQVHRRRPRERPTRNVPDEP